MSASERLRALAAQYDDHDAAYWLGRLMQEGALPLIADVVEAAERVRFSTRQPQLDRALTALREHLEGE